MLRKLGFFSLSGVQRLKSFEYNAESGCWPLPAQRPENRHDEGDCVILVIYIWPKTDTDTALIRRRCSEASASEECVEVNDGSNNIKLCSCDDKDLCNGAVTLSSTFGTCTAALFAIAVPLRSRLI